MAETGKSTRRAGASNHKAYWQQSWMTKVLSNGYCSFAKLVFMRIASFGERGCWMTNETLSEEFNRSERTIRRAVSSLWMNGDLIVTGWDGHGRKMYASSHPNVKEKLNADCAQMLARGRIESVSEYGGKVRLRVKSEKPLN